MSDINNCVVMQEQLFNWIYFGFTKLQIMIGSMASACLFPQNGVSQEEVQRGCRENKMKDLIYSLASQAHLQLEAVSLGRARSQMFSIIR